MAIWELKYGDWELKIEGIYGCFEGLKAENWQFNIEYLGNQLGVFLGKTNQGFSFFAK